MARRNGPRRQFVWARQSGTIGGAQTPQLFGVDLLAGVRVRYGEAVLRGATVMGIRGYIRFNSDETEGVMFGRAAVKVGTSEDVAGPPADIRAEGPWSDPEADWMLFQQSFQVLGGPDVTTQNPATSIWAVRLGLWKRGPTGSSGVGRDGVDVR